MHIFTKVDDFSRYMRTLFFKHKSEAFELFQFSLRKFKIKSQLKS